MKNSSPVRSTCLRDSLLSSGLETSAMKHRAGIGQPLQGVREAGRQSAVGCEMCRTTKWTRWNRGAKRS